MTWQYIAGFFDGEGSVTTNRSGFRVTIPQTDEVVLRRIQGFSGLGSICQVTKRQSHWRTSWVYAVSAQREVNIFLRKTRPYLVVKRRTVDLALKNLPKILKRQQQRRALASQRRKSVFQLRQRGFSYRRIGRELGIDWGHVRRIFLRGKKKL